MSTVAFAEIETLEEEILQLDERLLQLTKGQ
jgi:chorismate mutase